MTTRLYYDGNAEPIDEAQALELLSNFAGRVVGHTWLEFLGWDILVSTCFVPVDHDPKTWGQPTPTPALWLTEIIGGPEDLNGVTQYYHSRQAATEGHAHVVERAVASGCTVV